MKTNHLAPFAAILVCLAFLFTSTPAASDEGPALELQTENRTVEWDEDWERFRWWEYVASTTLMSAGFVSQFILPPPETSFAGGVLFDEPIYEALRPKTQSGWEAHALASDVGFYGAMAYRFVDAMIVGIAHDNWDVAWQMVMMDFESFSLIASTLWVSQAAGVGRERPGYSTCGEDDHFGEDCDRTDNRYRSFYAGHPATALSAAGSTCVHHYFMPLYGGGAADSIACGAMLAVAAVTGVERVVAGKHWTTDLLVGWGVGAATGFLVPLSLHYGFTRDPDHVANRHKLRLLPMAYGGDHLGATLAGQF